MTRHDFALIAAFVLTGALASALAIVGLTSK